MKIPKEIANAVVDPKAYEDGNRLDNAFSWLRREAPLALLQPDSHNPFWAVTRFADIQAIERQNNLFLSGVRSVAVATAELEKEARDKGIPVRTLVQMDNPDHIAYRRLTQEWFSPQNLRKLEIRIREVAKEFGDRMEAFGGQCDFARDIAFLYPLRIIMEILGVPKTDESLMLKLTQELFSNGDRNLKRKDADAGECVQKTETLIEFANYFKEMTEERSKNPRDDLASAIANGRVNGEPIGLLEAMGYYVIVATAGHDTTANSIAGGLWALGENPDQFQKLKTDPALINNFVEESIRWVTPVRHFMRTAAKDTELAGQKIEKGDWLMLCYLSANRDELQFKDPFKFDIERQPNKHIAFGFGPHVCLGQHLARLEMRILWEELLPRLKSVALDGKPMRTASTFVCGPKTVPIQYTM